MKGPKLGPYLETTMQTIRQRSTTEGKTQALPIISRSVGLAVRMGKMKGGLADFTRMGV
jgi:hypothetical protein